MDNLNDLIGTKEAAKIADTTPETLARSCRTGTIPAVKIGLAWMIRRSDLDAYIARRPRKGSPKVQNQKTDDYISTLEAAEISGTSYQNIALACRRGTLPAIKLEGNWVIRRSDLEAYLANKPRGGRPRKNPKS